MKGHPRLWVIRCSGPVGQHQLRDPAPSIPSTESTREQDLSDDLFHEPEAQPKSVTAEALSRDHPTWPPAQHERLPVVIQARCWSPATRAPCLDRRSEALVRSATAILRWELRRSRVMKDLGCKRLRLLGVFGGILMGDHVRKASADGVDDGLSWEPRGYLRVRTPIPEQPGEVTAVALFAPLRTASDDPRKEAVVPYERGLQEGGGLRRTRHGGIDEEEVSSVGLYVLPKALVRPLGSAQ